VTKRVDILGVHVSAVSFDDAIDLISGWVLGGERKYVCVTGVHGVMESQDDPELMRVHNESGMTTPDGMPMVWCGRVAGARSMTRVYGPDLMERVVEMSQETGWSHFLYGAAPEVVDELEKNLLSKYPSIRIAGTHSPPFRALEDAEVLSDVKMLNSSGANIIWVGLSTPKQERWMARFRPLLDAEVIVGVGAAFDIHAGKLRQAPRWMQRSGLEWLFRLLIEPRRLWRRYLSNNPRFLIQILLNRPTLIDPDIPS
jgi:N-acetylglucosaminyldiphosphoundecaprenol N-acetyl-beta-D-mannosaminyltransferase